MSLLEVNHLKKIYTARYGGNSVQALADVNFTIENGEYTAIMGESGSGKTTLLNIIATLDRPTSGTVRLEGQELSTIPERRLAEFRRKNLGFVFQDFNLLDTFSIRDNILLPLVLDRMDLREMDRRLKMLSEQLGLGELLDHYPYEVSGGQKQRAAVARALITNPRLILADEPSGALDSKSTETLLRIFEGINRQGQTISTRAASHAGRVLFIKDGIVYHQLYRGNLTVDQFYQKIVDTLTLITTGGRTNA